VNKQLIGIVAACIGLAGSAAPAAAGSVSATRPVIAIIAGELFVGEAEGHLNGAGTLAIHSQKDPALTCVGQFTSSAKLGGSGEIQCSDGAVATFRFQRVSIFRGHGSGSFPHGPMSFAYGYSAAEAAPYLKLPASKKLRLDGTVLTLVDL
jgi:hypothetical protein